MLENYTNAKDLEFEAHQYFVEAVYMTVTAISQTNDDYYEWLNGEAEKLKSISKMRFCQLTRFAAAGGQ